MKTMMSTLLSLAAATSMQAIGATVSDETLKDEILRFMRPVECVEMIRGQPSRPRVLTERISFDGDTNRLARALADVAQTNNAWYSEMAMRELEKYGTAEQLPFLYSCATNPAIGDLAVKAVLSIEGVTSNSLDFVHHFLSQTNGYTLLNADTRSKVCMDMIKQVFCNGSLSNHCPHAFAIATDYAENVNTLPKGLDTVLVSVCPDFRFSKRRLAILRSAKVKLDTEFREIGTTDEDVDERVHIYNFQTNYLFGAINELVAYPEADLPD